MAPLLTTTSAAGLYDFPQQTHYMNQEEFQAFWNQLLWGEGEMPDFMNTSTTETYDAMQYPAASVGQGYEYGNGHYGA